MSRSSKRRWGLTLEERELLWRLRNSPWCHLCQSIESRITWTCAIILGRWPTIFALASVQQFSVTYRWSICRSSLVAISPRYCIYKGLHKSNPLPLVHLSSLCFIFTSHHRQRGHTELLELGKEFRGGTLSRAVYHMEDYNTEYWLAR